MQIETIGLVDQVRMAAQKQNRIAAVIGTWLADLAPLGSFALAHFADLNPTHGGRAIFNLALLACCLAFSAPKVLRWARTTFGSLVEAIGFVGLTEGLSLAPHDVHWLLTAISFYALAVLVVVNSVTGAVRVALSQRELRAAARAQAVEHVTTTATERVTIPASSSPKKTTAPKKKPAAKKKPASAKRKPAATEAAPTAPAPFANVA